MLHFTLLTAQIAILIIAGTLLWQVWRFLKRADIPEDEPLGKERTHYLTHRLTGISVCAFIEAALAIAQTVLRMIEGL